MIVFGFSDITGLSFVVDMATCPAKQNVFFRYSAIMTVTPLRSRITTIRVCSHNDFLSRDISIVPCAVTSLPSS